MPKLGKTRTKLTWRGTLPFATLALAMGVILTVSGFTATAPVAIETESGTLSSGAALRPLSSASGGAAVAFSSAATPTPTPTPIPSTRPDATNTGVPAGASLKLITAAYPDAVAQGYTINAQGRVTITKDGGIYDRLLFTGGIVVKAKNITIKNSLITGGRSTFPTLPAEPTSWDQCRSIYLSGQNGGSPFIIDANSSIVAGLLIQDSEIAVNSSDYSIYVNNYMGHDTTMRRLNIHGGVDGIGTNNAYATTANFTIEDSYVHDLYKGSWSPGNNNLDPTTGAKMYCGYDAAHPEGTHNDGIQMHKGVNINVTRNTFFVNAVNAPQTNAGLMMNGAGNVRVSFNHFRWGVCSINMPAGLTLPVDVSNNTFYGNNGFTGTAGQNDNGCSIIRSATAGYTFSNNLWANGTAIRLIGG